jgi:hypothetical protein
MYENYTLLKILVDSVYHYAGFSIVSLSGNLNGGPTLIFVQNRCGF